MSEDFTRETDRLIARIDAELDRDERAGRILLAVIEEEMAKPDPDLMRVYVTLHELRAELDRARRQEAG